MSSIQDNLQLPVYQTFVDSIAPLELPFSGSELHGIMCGYLSAGTVQDGIAWLRTLIPNLNDPATRPAAMAIFEVFTVTQHQIESMGFEFQLLLLDENEPMDRRAQSFCDWCDGYTQGIRMSGVDYNELEDDDTQDALLHITEFADMDYESLDINEEDERALTEVIEYTRMAVLHIHSDLQTNHPDRGEAETAH